MTDGRPTCDMCIFWDRADRNAPDGKSSIWGLCRKGHAVPRYEGENFGTTEEKEWCGEHPDFGEWGAAKRKKQ